MARRDIAIGALLWLFPRLMLASNSSVQVRMQTPWTCATTSCSCTDLEMLDMGTGAVIPTDMQIHAVKYWPEPVGYQGVFTNPDRDPYTNIYQEIHARDLPVIRNELGANALLLAPWSFGHRSHTQFLEQATANNLKVIPSFDLSWYWEDGRWGSDLATRAALRKDFHDFLQYSALIQEDARLSTPESILLWNLEGLPSVEAILPRSCVAGALTDVANFRNCIASSGDLVDALNTVQTIQDMLQVVREAQREFHCEEGAQRAECAARDDVPVFKFDRPLALTIDLGDVYLSVAENSEYLAAFVFWMERVVGCHPVAVGQVQVPKSFAEVSSQCTFNGYGFFDMWILKARAVADDVEASAIRRLREHFSQPKQLGALSASSAASVSDLSGAMKPMILEFGFPAYTRGSIQPEKQHRALREVWSGNGGLKNAWSDGYCVRGVAVDEWQDVWSADERYDSCQELKSKFGHSTCGPLTDAGQLAVAYQGLVGQFHTFGRHCIQKRYEEVNVSSRFQFVDDLQSLQSNYIPPSVCAGVVLRRGVTLIAFFAASGLFVLLGLGTLCSLCRRRGALCARSAEDGEDGAGEQHCFNLEQLMQATATRKVLEDLSAVPFGRLLAVKVSEALEEGREVPVQYSHLRGYCGWGFAKVNGAFSYHRLQYNGRGRGTAVQRWDTAESFIRFLQEQSDRSLAVYGFTDAELRRTELIGNRTVRRRDLLELLDVQGCFNEGDAVTGRASAQLRVLGIQADLAVELSYRANPLFLSGVAEEIWSTPGDENDMKGWMARTGTNMRLFLQMLVNTHLTTQADRLRRQIEHEATAVAAEEQRRQKPELCDDVAVNRRACYNIWRRVLEGYHAWQGVVGKARELNYDEDKVHKYFVEALTSRLIGSIAEHLIHSPEWLAGVHQKVFESMNFSDNSGQPSFSCSVDYADLCEPLEFFCRNSNIFAPKQGINFDDINDCGLLAASGADTKKVQKTWSEPVGLWVAFHLIVNYKWVLTMAVWLLWSAFLLYDSEVFEDWVGNSSRQPTLRRFSFYSLAFIDSLWLCFLMLCEVFVSDSPSPSTIGRKTRNCCVKCLRACRVVPTLALALAWTLIAWPDVLTEIVGWFGLDSSILDVLPADFAKTFWYLPVFYILCRFVYGMTPRLRLTSAYQILQLAYFRRIALFWLAFGTFCFLCNYSMLVGLVRPLTPHQLCSMNDDDEDFCSTYSIDVFTVTLLVKDVRCIACNATVVASWLLVALSSMLMMYFIFNLFVAIVGSSVGAARGFVETSIPSLEFRVETVTTEFTSMRKAEASWMTHGSILNAVFGKEWQKVWEMMVDGLYDECLIDMKMRSSLLAAAKTGGSVKLSGKNMQILDRARARLGYLFTSLRSILGDANINFKPYTSADGVTDALGLTHRGRIPSLTQIVPVYSEEGIMDIKELVGDPKAGAVSTMLEFLISQLPREWEIFAQSEGLHPTELYERLCEANKGKGSGASKAQQDRIREWASHRAQSVIRTVNGAVHYHRALKVLLERDGMEKKVEFEDLRSHAQLIMAHQTYGKLSLGKAQQVKIQHGVITTPAPHGLRPNDRVRLTLDSLNAEDAVARRAVEKIWKNRAMNKLKHRAKTRQEVEAILSDGAQVQSLVDEVMVDGSLSEAVMDDGKVEAAMSDGGTPEEVVVSTSSSAFARHPALLGRLWGQAQIKGLQNFRGGGFYTIKEIVDDHTAVLSDVSVNCGTARLEKAELTKREHDVHYMLQKHQGFPFFVCIDFQRGKSHPQLEEMIDAHVSKQAVSGENLEEWASVRFRHASVLIKHGGDGLNWPIEIVHVLPRARGLLIGTVGNLTQGKAGNQLGALRFAEGHFVQMMDANMGCYSGETFKVPVVLQGFHRSSMAEGDYDHRLKLQARIIGFREHIFTREHGLVGQIMADAEWTFGTLVQRLLEFLTVRMHYGHPDFMDGFWAANRGSVSKASPHINLSEDIFAGLNVKIRHEQSLHTDYLEWEKGREVQFLAGSGFFWKIASGSVGLLRTRDLRTLCQNASIMETFALYFATVAWYIHNVVVDISTEVFVFIFIYLTLASKSIVDLGDLGSMLAAEWFLTPAFSAMLPAIIGLGIEYGPLWMIKNYIFTAPMSMVYFIFINKAMSSSVRTTFVANTAEYVNTGRPHANKSYTLLEAFLAYWNSHYRPALRIIYCIVLYRSMNADGALPLILVSFTAFVWILAPILFQPPTKTVLEQTRELVGFVAKVPATRERLTSGKPSSLYEAGFEQELKQANRGLVLPLLSGFLLCALYLFMTSSDILDQMWAPLCGMFILFLFRSVLAFSGIKSAGMMMLAIPCLSLFVIFFSTYIVENRDFGSLLVATLILIQFLTTVKLLVWSFFALLLPRGSPLGYEQVVRFTFDFLCIYELQFFGALVVLILQTVFAGLLWLLDRPPLRLRTGLILNRRVSIGCVRTIFGDPDSKDECITVKVDG